MQKMQWANLAMIGVIFLAAALRLPFLGQYPPQLHQDEASIAYNAWSIAKTGKDEWGVPWPTTFAAFGDAKLPGIIYLSAAVMRLTGFNPLVPRYVSAVAGVLSVVFGYLWITKKTSSHQLGLLASLIIATSYGLIHISRISLESNVALTMFIAALWLVELLKKSKERKHLLIAGILFAATTWTYIAYRLVVPIFIVVLWLTEIHRSKKIVNHFFSIGVVVFILISPQIFNISSTTRLQQVGIFSNNKVETELTQLRTSCADWAKDWRWWRAGCRIVWNPITATGEMLIDGAVDTLNPTFWFWKGDKEIPRNPLEKGVFPIFLLPFAMLGIILPASFLPILISLIPSALTQEANLFRLTPAIPFITLAIVEGLHSISLRKNLKNYIYVLIYVLIIISLTRNVLLYPPAAHYQYRMGYAYGKAIIDNLKTEDLAITEVWFDQIIDEPHIFLATWLPINPDLYHKLDLGAEADGVGFKRPTKIGDSYYFPSIHTKNTPIAEFCQGKSKDILLLSNHESLRVFEPEWQVKSFDNVHTIARAYRRSAIMESPHWKGLCPLSIAD